MVIITLICCFACSDIKRPPKPDNLIDKEKMVDVLYDVYLMNAAKGLKKKKLEQWGISPEKYILDKYKIDSLQFAQSNDFYAFDLETYQKIIDEVVQRLTVEKEKNERKRDSIQKARKQKNDSSKVKTKNQPKNKMNLKPEVFKD